MQNHLVSHLFVVAGVSKRNSARAEDHKTMQLVKWVMGTDMREKDVAVVACTGVGALGVGTGLSK